MINVCLWGIVHTSHTNNSDSKIEYKVVFLGSEYDISALYYKKLPKMMLQHSANTSYIMRTELGGKTYDYFYIVLQENSLRNLFESQGKIKQYLPVCGDVVLVNKISLEKNKLVWSEQYIKAYKDLKEYDVPKSLEFIRGNFKYNKVVGDFLKSIDLYNPRKMINMI